MPDRPVPLPEAMSTVELLLAATFSTKRDGWHSRFLFGQRPNAPIWQRSLGAAVFHTEIGLLETVLHLRRVGPNYLRSLSIMELQSKVTEFLVNNYPLIADGVWLRRDDVAFSKAVSPAAKLALAVALSMSDIFVPTNQTALFPLVPVRVTVDFDSDQFFLVAPSSLDEGRLQVELPWRAGMNSTRFPPWPDWKGVSQSPSAWLGTRSPILSRSLRMRGAILGALALLPHPRQRYLFSGRELFGGWAVVGNGWSTSVGTEGHTPPLMYDIVIEAGDHAWLTILAEKLASVTKVARKHVNALEYLYRAWPLSEVERFPVLFMALDAIFGDASRATASVVETVGPLMGPEYDASRLRRLLDLRAAVVHGGAPEVYDSRSYAVYYGEYMTDPGRDLEAITARCIAGVVFGGTLLSRPKPDYPPP